MVFPTTLDTFVSPASGTTMNAGGALPHHQLHADINAAVMALESRVGVTASVVTGSLTYRIATLESASSASTVFSVTSYGAVGDGVTNDTAAVTAGLTAAITLGKALYFPPGTYLISTRIALTGVSGTDQRLMMFANGDATIKMASTFTQTSGYSIIAPTGVDNVEISGFIFDGNRANLSPAVTAHPPYLGAIKITTAVTRTIITRCIFKNFVGDCVDGIDVTNFHVDYCDFSNSLASAVFTTKSVTGSFDINISHNKVYGIGQSTSGTNTNIGAVMILDHASERVNISNNFITDTPDTCSKTEGSSSVVYNGNVCKNFGKDGLKVQGLSVFTGPQIYDAVISNNILMYPQTGRSDGGQCIEFNFITRGSIVGNTCVGGTNVTYADDGITLLNGCTDIEIANNVCTSFLDLSLSVGTATSGGSTPVANDRIKIHHNKFYDAQVSILDNGEIDFSHNEVIGPAAYTGSTVDGIRMRRCDKVFFNGNTVKQWAKCLWIEPDDAVTPSGAYPATSGRSGTSYIEVTHNKFALNNTYMIYVRDQNTTGMVCPILDISDNLFETGGSTSSPSTVVHLSNKDGTQFTDVFFERNRLLTTNATLAMISLADEATGARPYVRVRAYDNENIAGIANIIGQGANGVSNITTLKQDSSFNLDHGGFQPVFGKGGVSIGNGHYGLTVANNVTNPNYQLDIAATELTVVNSSNLTRRITSVAVTVDVTVSGLGGLDSADAEAINKTYFVYVTYNASTGVVNGLLSENSNPSSITDLSGLYWGFVGVVRNDSASNFIAFTQHGREVTRTEATFVSGIAPTAADTLQAAAITHICPTGAGIKGCRGNIGSISSTVVPRMTLATDAAGNGKINYAPNCTGGTAINTFKACVPFAIALDDSGSLYWSAQDNTNAVNRITITGFWY